MPALQTADLAFPTAVGMNRLEGIIFALLWCVPHSRGDEPAKMAGLILPIQRSPQPWG